jgi:hypothetical protein
MANDAYDDFEVVCPLCEKPIVLRGDGFYSFHTECARNALVKVMLQKERSRVLRRY